MSWNPLVGRRRAARSRNSLRSRKRISSIIYPSFGADFFAHLSHLGDAAGIGLDLTGHKRYFRRPEQSLRWRGRIIPSIRSNYLITLLMLSGIACGEDFSRQGQDALEKNEYHKAIAAFTNAIEANPKGSENYRGRGDAYLQINQIDRALADLDKALGLDPRDSAALPAARLPPFG